MNPIPPRPHPHKNKSGNSRVGGVIESRSGAFAAQKGVRKFRALFANQRSCGINSALLGRRAYPLWPTLLITLRVERAVIIVLPFSPRRDMNRGNNLTQAKTMKYLAALLILAGLALARPTKAGDWAGYQGQDGPGNGKHIVFVSG